jgi:hypothetical protein
MFRISNYTVNDITLMFNSIQNGSNIQTIRDICISTENSVAEMIGVNSTVPLCTTVVSTESACGFKDMMFVTKFTNLEIYNSICYKSDFFQKNNEPRKLDCATIKNTTPFQKEIVQYLRTKYSEILQTCTNGMSQLNNYSDLVNYQYLFYYYTHKIKFMLDKWSDKFLASYEIDNANANYQVQLKRIDSMAMKRFIPLFICGGFVAIPFIVIGSYTACCWVPCFVACKIMSLDDEMEQNQLQQIAYKQDYWV